MAQPTYSIGEIANQAGINTSTIRYYESIDLLPEAERLSGQRRYDQTVLERLGIINVAKKAGFSLDETRILLTSTDSGEPAHEQIREFANRKLPEIEQLIKRALTVRDWLTVASQCDCNDIDVCLLFENLDSETSHQALPLIPNDSCCTPAAT